MANELFEKIDSVADPRAGKWPKEVLSGLAQVSRQCLDRFVKHRSTMLDVLPTIEGIVTLAAGTNSTDKTSMKAL
jgi:hypothetical protein